MYGADSISFFVPPCIDWSMPLLAGALLKRCVEDEYNVNVIDINLEFFNRVWNEAEILQSKQQIKSCIQNKDLAGSVREIVDLVSRISYKQVGADEYVFMRKASIIDRWFDSSSVMEGMSRETYTMTQIRDIIYLHLNELQKNAAFCISISVEDQIVPAFMLMQTLKSLFPTIPIIVGGNIASRLADQIAISPLHELCDVIIKGEGEESLLRALHTVGDVLTRDQPQIIECIKEKIQYENMKTPDFSWCHFERYLSLFPVLPITINRKCDWAKCEFCAIHACWDRENRVRKMDHVINDLKYYINRYGVRYFRIVDENVRASLLEDFASAVLQESLEITYEAYVRFDAKLSNREMARKLYRSGCRQLFWGVESIDSDVLRTVNKGTTPDIISQNLKVFAQAGILNYCFVLTGIPNTDVEAEERTIEFVTNNKDIHVVAIGSYVVDRLSPMHIDKKLHTKYSIELFDKGDLTTEIGYLHNGVDEMTNIKARTQRYIEKLYAQRHDYALTAVMDEETRLVLCSFFGNDFARRSLRELDAETKHTILNYATQRSIEERVLRNTEV